MFPDQVIPINVTQAEVDLVLNCLKNNQRLGQLFSISEGLRIPQKYETELENDFRIVKQYQFSRYSKITTGSFISNDNLSRILRPGTKRYGKTFSDKILIAEDALQITATIDLSESIPQGGIYFGVLTHHKNVPLGSILAVLNSKLLSFVYEVLFGGMHMGGGYLRYRTSFLENLPLPPLPKDVQSQLDKDAQQILAAKKANPAADTAVLEAEIDQLLYQLYGLTPEEIAIVESATND